jgi:hypothetical protein
MVFFGGIRIVGHHARVGLFRAPPLTIPIRARGIRMQQPISDYRRSHYSSESMVYNQHHDRPDNSDEHAVEVKTRYPNMADEAK